MNIVACIPYWLAYLALMRSEGPLRWYALAHLCIAAGRWSVLLAYGWESPEYAQTYHASAIGQSAASIVLALWICRECRSDLGGMMAFTKALFIALVFSRWAWPAQAGLEVERVMVGAVWITAATARARLPLHCRLILVGLSLRIVGETLWYAGPSVPAALVTFVGLVPWAFMLAAASAACKESDHMRAAAVRRLVTPAIRALRSSRPAVGLQRARQLSFSFRHGMPEG